MRRAPATAGRVDAGVKTTDRCAKVPKLVVDDGKAVVNINRAVVEASIDLYQAACVSSRLALIDVVFLILEQPKKLSHFRVIGGEDWNIAGGHALVQPAENRHNAVVWLAIFIRYQKIAVQYPYPLAVQYPYPLLCIPHSTAESLQRLRRGSTFARQDSVDVAREVRGAAILAAPHDFGAQTRGRLLG